MRSHIPWLIRATWSVLAAALFWGFAGPRSVRAEATATAPAREKIVFLGDSITDGNSYPLLVRQALSEAGKPVPVCVNAGIGGDTAAGMLKRLDRDVFVHHPSLVTLSAGINDVLHNVPDADYRRDVTAIADQMKAANVPLVILTTSFLGEKHADADKHLDAYNAILRQVAESRGCGLAEVNKPMRDARAAGKELLEADQVHPNYEGHRLMARAVLDALGGKDVPVPEKMKVELMPGVIRDWKVRAMPEKSKPLDDASASEVKPDETWADYPLPETRPADNWWLDQERQRGFAVSLAAALGKAKRYQAFAVVESKEPRKVFLNPGAGVESIWLNGDKEVYRQPATYTGWHAGRERIPVELKAGENTVIIETGGQFFLSVTDTNDW